MWKLLRALANLLNPPGETLTMVCSTPISVSAERLNNASTLRITGMASIIERPDRRAQFTITVSDSKSLRELHGILSNALHRGESPYFAPDDAGPLWEDEDPNIYQDIATTLGPKDGRLWLFESNVHLGGQTPHQVIRNGKAHWVRQLLRQYKLGNFS